MSCQKSIRNVYQDLSINVDEKILKAVAPFHYSGFLNFMMAPYETWKQGCENEMAN